MNLKIINLLQTLPEPYASKALLNYDPKFYENGVPIENANDAIGWAFDWEKSREGEEFWMQLRRHLEDGEPLPEPAGENQKPFKVADIHAWLKQVTEGQISYSRMVELMNEQSEAYAAKHSQKQHLVELMNGSGWVKTDLMPDYDGQYLVFIVRKNECGTVSKYQRVIECFMNRWVLTDEEERVTHWMALPQEPNRTVTLLQKQKDQRGELMKMDEDGAFAYKNTVGRVRGSFNVYQSKIGSIVLLMSNNHINLTEDQVNKLMIDVYSLFDFDLNAYHKYYKTKEVGEQCFTVDDVNTNMPHPYANDGTAIFNIVAWLNMVASAYAAQKNRELLAWKESAMKILSTVNDQEIGKLLGIPIGHSISENLLEKIKELKKEPIMFSDWIRRCNMRKSLLPSETLYKMFKNQTINNKYEV